LDKAQPSVAHPAGWASGDSAEQERNIEMARRSQVKIDGEQYAHFVKRSERLARYEEILNDALEYSNRIRELVPAQWEDLIYLMLGRNSRRLENRERTVESDITLFTRLSAPRLHREEEEKRKDYEEALDHQRKLDHRNYKLAQALREAGVDPDTVLQDEVTE
tara:strand:- start:11277 stop:11765 length:489 start_codon:yes stop_codon:yes gene_type:complete